MVGRTLRMTGLLLLWAVLAVAGTRIAHAEGSREWTDNGGNRAWLQYYGNGSSTAGITRDNQLKAYVNEGETIYLGSSAMGIGAGDILWSAPDGSTGQCSTQGPGVGKIVSRSQELLGPAPLFAGGYTPCSLVAGSGQTGIWFFVFISPTPGGGTPAAIAAGANWTQSATVSAVAAWDVTVVGTDALEKRGRVYVSYFPLTLGRLGSTFNTDFYVLTEDGFQYRVNLDGLEPTTFIIFSNNKGFKLAATDEPSYQSVPLVGGEQNNSLPPEFSLNGPDDPDAGTDVTHKIFLHSPATDLPLDAKRPDGLVIWLLRPVTPPIDVTALDFTPNGNGIGGTFTFNSNQDGRYQIIVDTNNDGVFAFDSDVVLSGDTVPGANSVPWDGQDPQGAPVDPETCYQTIARGIAGETHIPFYDAEENPNGFIIERQNGPDAPDYRIYYNDVAIGGGQAINGEISTNGGHKWSVVPGGDPDGFGNQRGIDTWAYAIGQPAFVNACTVTQIEATKSDRLFADNDGDSLPSPGDELEYTVVIRNDGQTDAIGTTFSDIPGAYTTLVTGTVAATLGTITAGNASGDTSVGVDLGTLAETAPVTVTFRVRITSPLPAGVNQVANQGFVSALNTPTEPTDDPDTPTDDDPTVTPVTAVPLVEVFKRDQLAVDADGDGVPSPGDELEYVVTFVNLGNTTAQALVFDDTPDVNSRLVVGSVTTTQGTVEQGNIAGDTSVRVALADLPGGSAVATVTFRVRISDPLPAGVTRIANQGVTTGSNIPAEPSDDPDTPFNDDPTETPVNAAPRLEVLKRDSLLVDNDQNGVPSPGDVLLYQIAVANRGNQNAASVIFTDTPDANAPLVPGSVRTSQGTVTTGNGATDRDVRIEIGEIAGLVGTVDISFHVQVVNPLPLGVTQVDNQGYAQGTGLTTTPSDDPDTPQLNDPTRTPVVAAPVLDAFKSDILLTDVDQNGVPSPGDVLLYQVSITNLGNQEAINVLFDDTPGEFTSLIVGTTQSSLGVIEFGNGQNDTRVRVAVGTLQPGVTATISFQVRIASPLPANVKQVANQGLIAATNHGDIVTDDPDTSAVDDPTTTPLVAEPNLVATKRDLLLIDAGGDSVVSAGDTLLYQVILLNNGNAAAQNVLFTDAPDVNTSLVVGSVQTTSGQIIRGNTVSDGDVELLISELPAGTSVIIAFQVRVANPLPAGTTQVSNQGIATPTGGTAVPTDDPDTPPVGDPTITPVSPALVVIAKDATPTPGANVHPGDVIEYRLRVTNQGQTRLTNVVVRDPVPDDTVYEGSDTVPAPTLDGNMLVWELGSLAGGSSMQLSFRVRVRADASLSAIINMATVSTTEIPRAESNQIQHPLTEPTAIDLVSFNLEHAGQDNIVRWRTGAEFDTFGFHLWRADTPVRGAATRITPAMVMATGSDSSYSYVDAGVSVPVRYYWLEEVETSGKSVEYGPVAGNAPWPGSQVTRQQVFLPLLQK
jgi:uncharacterized repeat protein (TIGR01451 family)